MFVVVDNLKTRGNASKRFAYLAKTEPGLNIHLIDRCSHLAMIDQADELVIEFVTG
jgi:hypothetical protein